MGHRIILLAALFAAIWASAQPASESDLNSPQFWIERVERNLPRLDKKVQLGTCDWLASVYGSLGDRPRFRATAAKVKELTATLDDKHLRASMIVSLALHDADVGDDLAFSQALRDAAAINAKLAASFGLHICLHFIQTGRLDRALDWARKADTPQGRATLLADVAAAQAKAGRKPYAAATFREAFAQAALQAKTAKPADIEYTYTQIAQAQVRAGDYDAAASTYQKLPPNKAAAIEVQIAEARLAAGDRAGYSTAIERAIDLNAKGETQAATSVYTDSSWAWIGKLIAGADDDAHFKMACERAGKMRPSVEISADFERAIMKAEAGDVDGSISLLNATLAAAAKQDELTQAQQFKEFKRRGVMCALAKAGKHQAAMELAAKMPSLTNPDERMAPEIVYADAAEAEAEGQQFALAQSTMMRITDRSKREQSSARVILAAAKAGMPLDELLKWIDSFGDVEARTNAYCIVTNQLIERWKSHVSPATQR